jgi:hypothetical protein
MVDVLAIVQVVAALLLLVPLVVVAACALRRSGRKIDQIIQEECGRDAPIPDARSATPARTEGRVARPSTRTAGGRTSG